MYGIRDDVMRVSQTAPGRPSKILQRFPRAPAHSFLGCTCRSCVGAANGSDTGAVYFKFLFVFSRHIRNRFDGNKKYYGLQTRAYPFDTDRPMGYNIAAVVDKLLRSFYQKSKFFFFIT